jgi:hypothetical protein
MSLIEEKRQELRGKRGKRELKGNMVKTRLASR